MKEAAAKAWTEALRSGKYKQGAGVLRDESGRFCVLGVLCDLYDPTGWSRGAIRTYTNPAPGFSYRGLHDVLPMPVMEQAGIADQRGELWSLDGQSLAEMNDAGKSFVELADIIEREWRNL